MLYKGFEDGHIWIPSVGKEFKFGLICQHALNFSLILPLFFAHSPIIISVNNITTHTNITNNRKTSPSR